MCFHPLTSIFKSLIFDSSKRRKRKVKLVIVESPYKCHTISKYLGKDYEVVASKGHIRELATSGSGGLGIDVANGYEPSYKISPDKRQIVSMLIEKSKKASEVILASDHDREGEAIAWHLTQVLNLNPKKVKRILFNEVTRDAVNYAIAHPTNIDLNLVYSQEARRMLDRIIGFKLSTLLYKKIHSRSAGRVQSATLKFICDRQIEINNFIPEEYYTLSVVIELSNGVQIKANLDKINGKKASIKSKEENDEVLEELNKPVVLKNISKSKKSVSPKPPLKTSLLQQLAFSQYGMSVKKTSSIAQELYEGVEINGEVVGLITYIRVDSQTFSQTFVNRASEYITNKYGKEYLSNKVRKENAPEGAHEPIRPTSLYRTPESVRSQLSKDQYKIYKLIYDRAIESLIADKLVEQQTIEFAIGNLLFKTEYTSTLFDGFDVVNESKEKGTSFLKINKDEPLKLASYENELKHTTPPSNYNQGSVIEKMEQLGIGRPSTYQSTVNTLLDSKRNYLVSENQSLIPTDKGMYTIKVLQEHFKDFVDAEFTAKMEQELDEIAAGNLSRTKVIEDFYGPFIELVEKADKKLKKEPIEKLDKLCPRCGKPLVIRRGKFGDFTTCSDYPNCDYVEKEVKYTGENCPECGKPLVIKRKGKNQFIACSGYPECTYIKKQEKSVFTQRAKQELSAEGKICPLCGAPLTIRKGRYSSFLGCSNYPKCHYQEKLAKK